MKIGIIGANGFIGSKLVEILDTNHNITGITKQNYLDHTFDFYDILINAAGNSKKYLGNSYPLFDFEKSVTSTYKFIHEFNFKKYIQISSIDAENPSCTYGFNKYLAEEIVKFKCRDYSIIRLSAVIGKNSTKGVVYDIMKKRLIYLTPQSTLMLIEINELTTLIKNMLEKKKLDKLIKIYPKNNININEIAAILNKKVNYAEDLREEHYTYEGNYETSEYYLKKYIENERME